MIGLGEKEGPGYDHIATDHAETEQVIGMRDEEAGRGMSQHRSEQEGAGIQGDGRRQLFFRNDLGNDGLQGRTGEGSYYAGAKDDGIGQPLNPMRMERRGQRAESQRQQTDDAEQVARGRTEQQCAFIAAVDDMTRI